MTKSTSRRPAYARLLNRAVRILAVRNHSKQKLQRKLAAPIMGKNGPKKINATAKNYKRVIAWCHKHGYLNNSQFVARFIASRSRKGYKPARIRQKLNQKGISRKATKKAMRKCNINWCALARNQATQKYGKPLPTVFSKKVKIQRFLLYRGYLIKDIQKIWQNFAN